MERATPVSPAVEAITGLRAGLTAGGITGMYACDAGGSAMLGCPGASGGAPDDLVIWCNGEWFWWRSGKIRRGRQILTVHSAADPAGAARRIQEYRRVQSAGQELNGKSRIR